MGLLYERRCISDAVKMSFEVYLVADLFASWLYVQEHVSAVSEGELQDIRNSGASLCRVPSSYSACEIPRSVRSSSVCISVTVHV